MRQGQNAKRSRGRGRRGGGQGFSLNRVFESNGPDVKVRGTVQQVYEKYLNLSRDANSAGDRIAAETYLQHAEHYFRLMCAMQAQSGQPRSTAQTPVQGYEPQPEVDTTPGAQGRDDDDDEGDEDDDDMTVGEAQVERRSDRDAAAREVERQQEAGRAAARSDDREAEAAEPAEPAAPRRGRGRPRRRPDGDDQPRQEAAPAAAETGEGAGDGAGDGDAVPKRRRGRPRKVQADAAEPVTADN